MMENRCVCCGEIIPEGRMVCPKCENFATNICESYRSNYYGVDVCFGTKERDACSCNGDENKCDFYPEKREKAKYTVDKLVYMHDETSPLYSITREVIAAVVTKENKAIIKAIREYAKEKRNVALLEIPEETLLKILDLGSKALQEEEKNDQN